MLGCACLSIVDLPDCRGPVTATQLKVDICLYVWQYICMKTTLNFPDPLVLKAKRRAVEEGTTLTDLIVQGLQARLEKNARSGTLPVSTAAGGLVSGVTWKNLKVAEGSEDSYR